MKTQLRTLAGLAIGLAQFGCSSGDTSIVSSKSQELQVDNVNGLLFAQEFNAFAFDTYEDIPHSQGPVAAGELIKTEGFAINDSSPYEHGVVSGGNIDLTSGSIYGTSQYVDYLLGDHHTVGAHFIDTNDPAIPFDFDIAEARLTAQSDALSEIGENGSVTATPWSLSLHGSDAHRNVFSVSASELDVSSITVTAPTESTVIINVSGSSADVSYLGMSLSGGITANRILWNFADATSLNLTGISFQGSALAPRADVNFNWGNFEGTLVARNIRGTGEFHHYPFQGNLPDAPEVDLQRPSKSSPTDVRVMSINIRINEPADNLQYLVSRIPRIREIVDEYSPDIIGIQEGELDTWDNFAARMGAGYGWAYRTRGGLTTPDELVAIMYNASRFELLEHTGITVNRKEWRDRGDCPNNPGIKNRTVQRVKLHDLETDEILDVFNTHFPTGDDCEKEGMAMITKDYVRKFGDNALLMGDFNTGIDRTGARDQAYKLLTTNSTDDFFADTYVHNIGIALSGEDEVLLPDRLGHSYITDEARKPYKRLGEKIDHIFTAPAFVIKKAGIDRSLFLGTKRYDCSDDYSDIDEEGFRTHCQDMEEEDFQVASDHWAIWADVNRPPCDNFECAASR